MHFQCRSSRADQTPEVLLTPMQSTHFRGGDVTSPSFFFGQKPRKRGLFIPTYVKILASLVPSFSSLAQILAHSKSRQSNGQQR